MAIVVRCTVIIDLVMSAGRSCNFSLTHSHWPPHSLTEFDSCDMRNFNWSQLSNFESSFTSFVLTSLTCALSEYVCSKEFRLLIWLSETDNECAEKYNLPLMGSEVWTIVVSCKCASTLWGVNNKSSRTTLLRFSTHNAPIEGIFSVIFCDYSKKIDQNSVLLAECPQEHKKDRERTEEFTAQAPFTDLLGSLFYHYYYYSLVAHTNDL